MKLKVFEQKHNYNNDQIKVTSIKRLGKLHKYNFELRLETNSVKF